MKIYLAGGMKSGWQDTMPKVENVTYFNPIIDSPQNLTMSNFVEKDLEAVRNSDIIFCYMEKSNPTGYGAIWECAVAVENNIPVFTVWEKDYIDPFIAYNSLFLFNNFETGKIKFEKYINSIK